MALPFNPNEVDEMLLGVEGVVRLDQERKQAEILQQMHSPALNKNIQYFKHRYCTIHLAASQPIKGWVEEIDELGIMLNAVENPVNNDAIKALVFWDSVASIEEMALQVRPNETDSQTTTEHAAPIPVPIPTSAPEIQKGIFGGTIGNSPYRSQP